MIRKSARTHKGQRDAEPKRNRDSRKCKGHEEPRVNLKTGTVVEDKYPPEEIKLIEIPLKKSHLSLNLSDESFESMADKVGDTFDVKHERVLTGKEALAKLNELQHANSSHKGG